MVQAESMPIYGRIKEEDPERWAELVDQANIEVANREYANNLGSALKRTLEAAGWVRFRENELEPPQPEDVMVAYPRTWRDRRVVRFLYAGGEAEITVIKPEQRGTQVAYPGAGAKFRIWGPPDPETERKLIMFLLEHGVRLPDYALERGEESKTQP